MPDFIYLADLLPDNFCDEQFAVVALVEIMSRIAGTNIGSLVRAEKSDYNAEEVFEDHGKPTGAFTLAMQEYYQDFDLEAFKYEWSRLNISAPECSWDEGNRMLDFWDDAENEAEFEGLYCCEHCGDQQVSIPDHLAYDIVIALRSASPRMLKAALCIAQRGFNEFYFMALLDEDEFEEFFAGDVSTTRGLQGIEPKQEDDDSLRPVMRENMGEDQFWAYFRGLVDEAGAHVEKRSDGSTGGVALNTHNSVFTDQLIQELRKYEINVTQENVLESKGKMYLYVPAEYTKLICDKAYRDLENEALSDDNGQPFLDMDHNPLCFKDVGSPEKKKLLYAAK